MAAAPGYSQPIRALAVAAVALLLAPVAQGANVADARMAAVASWAAGKPISVHCESDAAEWSRLVSEAGLTAAGGFTYHGRPEVFIGPDFCYGLSSTTPELFGPALNALLHEAYTHYGGGVYDQGMQECGAKVLIYEALRRFWNVPFFTPRMRAIVNAALDYSQRKPAAYQRTC